MTKDEALKLALNELVWASRYCDIQTGVIEAVKEALAQEQQSCDKPELCKYGNEIESCTSDPMDCQCSLDALFN